MEQNYEHFTLDADIATGWKPKMRIIGPMPLNFDNNALDKLIKPLIHSDTSPHEVVYLGIRPRDTFEMHSLLAKNYRYKFRHLLSADYSHLKPFFKKFYSQFEPEYKLPFSGMSLKSKSSIIFESRFESGNLDCAIRTKTNEYDLFLRIDSNTNGHVMWYNFRVQNRQNKNIKVRLNICNLRRSKVTFEQCMKPYVYRNGKGWNQQDNNVHISEDSVRFHRQYTLLTNMDAQMPTLYRKLCFDVQLDGGQEVEIAYSIPYTYSKLLSDIKDLKAEALNQQGINFQINMSNLSLSGLEIPYLKIFSSNDKEQTQFQQKKSDSKKLKKKQEIFIIGRQHPGQSNGSHVLQGFMSQLVKSTDPKIKNLFKYFNFHIIPMLNPDGVVIGNYRTSLYGKDLNRLFRRNQTFMIPEIQFCKNLVFEVTKKKKKRLFMFMDFHGHSMKKNAFFYAPGTFDSNSLDDIRDFPKVIAAITQVFRYPSCSFRISTHKKTTARAVFCADSHLCYTVQTSNWSFYSRRTKVNTFFTQSLWNEFGQNLMIALGQYYENVLEKKAARKKRFEDKKLGHGTSQIFKVRAPKKVYLKTHQSINESQKIISFSKKKQVQPSNRTQKVLPSSTRSIENNLKLSTKSQMKQKSRNLSVENFIDNQEMEQQVDHQSQDSDESDVEDMDKEKFKKYINVATKMFIQFEKVYYGDQYGNKAKYQMPKKNPKRKERQIPIVLQACLRMKSKHDHKIAFSDKGLLRPGLSEDRTRSSRNNLGRFERSQKKGSFKMNSDDLVSKQQILKSFPKINVVNYLAYDEIDERKTIRIPKIESALLKTQSKRQ